MIQIVKYIQTPVELYNENNFIGLIENAYELTHVMHDISENRLKGYFIKKDVTEIEIDEFGRLASYPRNNESKGIDETSDFIEKWFSTREDKIKIKYYYGL